MYYPYFRGKQFELLTIREMAPTMSSAGFVPIIEPVQDSLNGLTRALDAVVSAEGEAIVVLNPEHGSHSENGDRLVELFEDGRYPAEQVSYGLLLKPTTPTNDITGFLEKYRGKPMAFIHYGFKDAKFVADQINQSNASIRSVFVDDHAGFLYRKHFQETSRVLLKDGFSAQKKNALYPSVELFSDLHLTYKDQYGASAFGDFLIVGDNYSEGGGPAYAVAIHLTFIDESSDQAMYINHFVSDTNDSPTDTPGKFAEALEKLMISLDTGRSRLAPTRAVAEFKDLHKRGHFPGLGYVKKLSMNHHIETLARFFQDQ